MTYGERFMRLFGMPGYSGYSGYSRHHYPSGCFGCGPGYRFYDARTGLEVDQRGRRVYTM